MKAQTNSSHLLQDSWRRSPNKAIASHACLLPSSALGRLVLTCLAQALTPLCLLCSLALFGLLPTHP